MPLFLLAGSLDTTKLPNGDYVVTVRARDIRGKETLPLREGDLVALPGDFELHDAMAVRVMNTDSSNVRGRVDAN